MQETKEVWFDADEIYYWASPVYYWPYWHQSVRFGGQRADYSKSNLEMDFLMNPFH